MIQLFLKWFYKILFIFRLVRDMSFYYFKYIYYTLKKLRIWRINKLPSDKCTYTKLGNSTRFKHIKLF